MKLNVMEYFKPGVFLNMSDGKKIWKGIKQIIHFKPTTSVFFINNNNKEFSDPKHAADAFYNYFDVGNKLENEIPTVNKNPEEYLGWPTTSTEIKNILSSLKSGKAVGPF